jgi:perosamine synthetase
MHEIRIPWASPSIGEAEIAAVTRTLRERRLSMGREVRAFEEDAAALFGTEHAIAVSNGTVALDLALKLVGVTDGDEVLVSALSYIATTNSILWQRAVPVFCDVDPRTLNIDPEDVARRITARTKALLVSDYCGSPVDYGRLVPLCREHDIELVVDGAQSVGAAFDGRPTCGYGRVATTSFHTAKAVLTGEGGMVFTDDAGLEERCRRMRGQGEIPGRKYVHDTLAWNYRLTELAAAIGRVQLARAGEIQARRAELVERYDRGLERLSDVERVGHHEGATPGWFSVAILVPERDAVADTLRRLGVETRSLYPMPTYRQPIPEYAPYAAERRPNAERASQAVLNLPLFYEMTDAQVDEVVDALGQALRQHVPGSLVGNG